MPKSNESESFYTYINKSQWKYVYSALLCTAVFFVLDLSRGETSFPMTLGGLTGTLIIFLVNWYFVSKKSEGGNTDNK